MDKIIDRSGGFRYTRPFEELTFPNKINIHFPLRGVLYHHVVRINNLIAQKGEDEISFAATSFHVPHITLYSCFIDTKRNLDETMSTVQRVADHCSPLNIVLQPPYLKEPKRAWAFMDVDPADIIYDLKKNIESELRGIVIPMNWDVVGEPPHVTVGYVGRAKDSIVQMLKGAPTKVEGVVNAIELSFAGVRGCCLGSIRTFEFLAKE